MSDSSTASVIVAPAAVADQVMATPLNGGWGQPATSANGLCAWGVAAELFVDETRPALAVIAGVVELAYDGAGAWKVAAGWVDAVEGL